MDTNNGTTATLITERGYMHMKSMFEDSAKIVRREVADADKLLTLLEDALTVTATFDEEDSGRTRKTLTYDQLAILFRALEKHISSEEERADRLEDAVAECDRALANAEKGA